jgi:hypothetical protein
MRKIAIALAGAGMLMAFGAPAHAGETQCQGHSAGFSAKPVNYTAIDEFSSRRWRRDCFGDQGRCKGFWRNGRKVVICCD